MSAITNPQAVGFCNNQIRPAADRFIQLYYWCKLTQQQWTAQGLAALLPNSTDNIVDGSATDGRTPITDGQVNILMNYVNTFITAMEASSSLEYNQIAALAVNLLP
jgi:hypothetical protein